MNTTIAEPVKREAHITDEERELVRRAKSRDEKALNQIWSDHGGYVYRQALKMLGNHEDAEDVAQDVEIKFFSAFESFRGEAALRTWFHSMTRNACLNFLMRKSRMRNVIIDNVFCANDERGFDETEYKDESADFLERLMSEEGKKKLIHTLGKMLTKLSLRHRQILVLHHIGNMSLETVAKMLGRRSGTMRSRHFCALRKARSVLKKYAKSA